MSILIKNAFRESLLYTDLNSQDPEQIGLRSVLVNILNDIIENVAKTNTTIFVTGESGTGKEVIAEIIHKKSDRKDKPYIIVDAACVPETLIESELFGHEKGAFTGAVKDRIGKVEEANGGTLFLDEIGNVSPWVQAKLLRVLQYKEFTRVGGGTVITSDFRLICATNINTAIEMEKGNFRKDLFYRINVIPIHIPPLRETPDDIPVLAEHFLDKICKQYKRDTIPFSGEIKKIFESYSWPGNVRELINIVERLVLLYKKGGLDIKSIFNMGSETEYFNKEKIEIIDALTNSKGKVPGAAVTMHYSTATLYRRIKKYNINTSIFKLKK